MKKLGVLMTLGNSLSNWSNNGQFNREIKLYEKMQYNFKEIIFITYGNQLEENILLQKYKKIRAISLIHYSPNKNIFYKIKSIFSILLSIYRLKYEINSIDVIKTKQFKGAFVALLLKFFYKIKLVLRFGYDPYMFFNKKNFYIYSLIYRIYLKIVFKFSDKIIYTETNTFFINNLVNNIYKYKCLKINNWIDKAEFNFNTPFKNRKNVLFIGRLEHQKNIPLLIQVIEHSSYNFTIVGDGKLHKFIQEKFTKNNRVTIIKKIKHTEIGHLMSKHLILINTSFFEGQPKILLEGLASGLILICSDVEGNKQIIKNNTNGFLIKNNFSEYVNKIDDIHNNKNNYKNISLNGKICINEEYNLESILKKEIVFLDI